MVSPSLLDRARGSGNTILVKDIAGADLGRVGAPRDSGFNEQVPSLPQSGEPQD